MTGVIEAAIRPLMCSCGNVCKQRKLPVSCREDSHACTVALYRMYRKQAATHYSALTPWCIVRPWLDANVIFNLYRVHQFSMLANVIDFTAICLKILDQLKL